MIESLKVVDYGAVNTIVGLFVYSIIPDVMSGDKILTWIMYPGAVGVAVHLKEFGPAASSPFAVSWVHDRTPVQEAAALAIYTQVPLEAKARFSSV